MADRTGQQLGNYRLLCLLGRGGFADVYLGQHIHLETQAAIKVLHTILAHNDIERFRAEARMIARLHHPHIVRVLEFGIEDNVPFLVMDYASGGPLRKSHAAGSRVPLETARTYITQIAAALQYAHNRKVIHRDVKPENMLLGDGHQILLSDFGIALIAYSSHAPHEQNAVGTINYMAPEHIQGQPHFASDQYSLGIVVYEWLCGTRPFHGSFTELCTQHLMASPPPLRQWTPTLPPAVEQIVLTTLAKDPTRRFASIQDFATAFAQASQPQQISAAHEPAQSSFSPLVMPPHTLNPAPAESAHPLHLIPHRTGGSKSGLIRMLKPTIADRQARRLHDAIDGKKNLEELRTALVLDVADTYRAARFLLLQQRIELRLAGGQLPTQPQTTLIPPASQAIPTLAALPIPPVSAQKPSTPPSASSLSVALLQLVPHRIERASLADVPLLRQSKPVIADKSAQRLHDAIDGKKNLEELRTMLLLSIPGIYRATRFLLLQQRIDLHLPGGGLVTGSIQLFKDA